MPCHRNIRPNFALQTECNAQTGTVIRGPSVALLRSPSRHYPVLPGSSFAYPGTLAASFCLHCIGTVTKSPPKPTSSLCLTALYSSLLKRKIPFVFVQNAAKNKPRASGFGTQKHFESLRELRQWRHICLLSIWAAPALSPWSWDPSFT